MDLPGSIGLLVWRVRPSFPGTEEQVDPAPSLQVLTDPPRFGSLWRHVLFIMLDPPSVFVGGKSTVS